MANRRVEKMLSKWKIQGITCKALLAPNHDGITSHTRNGGQRRDVVGLEEHDVFYSAWHVILFCQLN